MKRMKTHKTCISCKHAVKTCIAIFTKFMDKFQDSQNIGQYAKYQLGKKSIIPQLISTNFG